MKHVFLALVAAILFSHANISFAETRQDQAKKYARVNRFLDTKFPRSKAAPSYYQN